jgi:hypothetical protein
MKVTPKSPPLLRAEPAKAATPKKTFKEIYKAKKETDIPSFNLYLPPSQLEVSAEEYLIELTHVIREAIENNEISTEFSVRGTTIMIEQFGTTPGHLHIHITTQGDQFDLLQSHLGRLDLALKTALPHISCHLAPLQVHATKNRCKNSASSDMVKTRWMNGQKKFTP